MPIVFSPCKNQSGFLKTTTATTKNNKKAESSHITLFFTSYYFSAPDDLTTFLFHSKYDPKSLSCLKGLPNLTPRHCLVSSPSFPCYLGSKTGFLTKSWIGQAWTLVWASACNSFPQYPYGSFLASFRSQHKDQLLEYFHDHLVYDIAPPITPYPYTLLYSSS